MARLPLAPPKLKVQVASTEIKKEGPAFYIVPPILVAAVFAFCAWVPKKVEKPAPAPAATAAAPAAPAAKPAEAPAPKTAVTMVDPNTGLPDYEIPSGCENVFEGAEGVSISSAAAGASALNAVDGSCEDDGHVAVAVPVGGEPAWWQVRAGDGSSFTGETLVIYGGGSKSKSGKMLGGFRVELMLDGGASLSRDFCEAGFALEGYETWKLGGNQKVISVRVSALQPDKPVVLREVQLIGPAAGN